MFACVAVAVAVAVGVGVGGSVCAHIPLRKEDHGGPESTIMIKGKRDPFLWGRSVSSRIFHRVRVGRGGDGGRERERGSLLWRSPSVLE